MPGRLLRKVLEEMERLHNADPDVEKDEPEPDSPAAAPCKIPFDLLDDGDDNQEDDQEITGDRSGKVTKQEYSVVKNSSDVSVVSNRKSKKKSKDESASTKLKADESVDSVLADLSINSKPSSQAAEFENIKARNSEVQPGKKHSITSVLLVEPKHP